MDTSEKEYMNEIIETIMKVARGDLSVQIEPSERNDDIDSLAMGLNMMIDDISSNYQRIQATQEAVFNIAEDLEERGKKLDALNEQLEQENAERRKAQEALKDALKDLKAKNVELDNYTYMTSHDLKAPLVTIQGFAGLLKKKYGKELSEGAMHYVDIIISGAEDLSHLVTDLLALSRAGRGKGEVESVAFAKAVQSSLRSLQGMIDEKEVDVSVPDDLPVMPYNPTQLKEVFTNLLSNAIKYSKPGKKSKIEVGWKENAEDNLIWVKDNGIGIDERHKDKIFEAFERITKDQKGTGIGLSIVKKIIELHGGRVWVESKFGEGSKFNFTVPKEV